MNGYTTTIAVLCTISSTTLAQPDPSMEIIAVEGLEVPGLEDDEFIGAFTQDVAVDDDGAVYWATTGFSGGGLRTGVLRTADQDAEFLIRGGVVPDGLDLALGRSFEWSIARSGLEGGLAVLGELTSDQNRDALVLIRTDGNQIVAVDQDPIPDGTATLSLWNEVPVINRSGAVLVNTRLFGNAGGSADDTAIFQYDPSTDSLSIAVREGDPDGAGQTVTGTRSIGQFTPPGLADNGDIAFRANRSVFPGQGVYRKPAGGSIIPIALRDTVSSFGITRTNFSDPGMNPAGDIGYGWDSPDGSTNNEVLAVFQDGVLRERLVTGPAPTPDGGDLGFLRGRVPSTALSMGGNGLLAFTDETFDPSGDGLFFTDGQTISAIARRGLAAPGGGVFERGLDEADFYAGEGGHVLFKVDVNDDFSDRTNAVFLWTLGEGTRRLISEGDLIDGTPVRSIDDIPSTLGGAGPVNRDGVASVSVTLLDDRTAILRFGRESVCLADVNADGELNGLDFGAWLGAFNAGLPAADQNEDGEINGLDFGAWLSGFNAGCP